MTDKVIRDDNTINAKALFDMLIEATAMSRPDLEADIRAKVKELSALRAEIQGKE